MPAGSGWDLTPRQSVELECARRGRGLVIAGCVALLGGQDVDDNLIMALGGPAGRVVLDDGPKQRNQYWRRVWGARGLLYAFDESAAEAITEALGDEHWRVREMAAKAHREGQDRRGESERSPGAWMTESRAFEAQPSGRSLS